MLDYHKKYLKYKNKYLELKNESKIESKIDNKYISKLKELYPECIHDDKAHDVSKYQKTGYATTYGEMNYSAIEKFNLLFNSFGNIKYFIDFGSGRGKLPLYMGDKVSKSIGIELVTERHNDAIKLKKELSNEFEDITNKVTLLNQDMFEYLKNINKDTFTSPVLIWISNLCFGDKITSELFYELVKKMPSGSIIGSSKIPSLIPSEIYPVILPDNEDNKIIVSMSWSEMSTIYVYKIK